jgi:hypothetical protein
MVRCDVSSVFGPWERLLPLGTLLLVAASFPGRASAGGTEFPGGGARSLGRGGAALARADDPALMTRNPALLADLWDDQALLGASLLLVDSCFRPSGGYGAGNIGVDVSRFGGEIITQRLPAGSTHLDGRPLTNYQEEPFPTICYEGPAPFLPHLALSAKLAPDLGVGIGFFPPDNASLNQFGNRDGSVDTPNGPRPNPLRAIRAHLNASYFSVLGAVGYRLADWVRIGVGFQWQLVVFEARSMQPSYLLSGTGPRTDIRADAFGRDLFIPGVIGSIHLKPFDELDIALGAKWSDRINGKAKIDITSSPHGLSEPFSYIDGNTGLPTTIGVNTPTTTHNQSAEVSAPPIWVPQLSAGIRYADRLKPRVRDKSRKAAHAASRGVTEDSMETERWDIELDVIYFFTSAVDRTDVTLPDVQVTLRTLNAAGGEDPPLTAWGGDCVDPKRMLMPDEVCKKRVNSVRINGRDQIAARLGGDYNILPGLFTVRAGASYETDGQAPSWMSPFQFMARRIGVHTGVTVRIARKTDVSLGFAWFIQKEVRLQLNPLSSGQYTFYQADPERYHLAPGELDGVAAIEVPNTSSPKPGPIFVNAGSQHYALSVLSASISQRF